MTLRSFGAFAAAAAATLMMSGMVAAHPKALKCVSDADTSTRKSDVLREGA